ncbi:MAG: sterol desaturase family protein [Alphaproteobacteria bacterium]|nr:sterol desaturase family protein [Alphaproteobacteria bacterium]
MRAHLPYPTTLAASLILAWVLLSTSLPHGVVAGVVVGCMLVLVAIWERVLPHAEAWKPSGRTVRLDLTHMIVTATTVVPAVRATLTVLVGDAVVRQLGAWGVQPWPTEAPLLLQVALAVVVADAGAYAAHRWMHGARAGWWIHAVHHSPPGLHVVASARSHPFNAALTYAAETGPLLLLGVGPEALVLWSVLKATNGLLQHANVAFARSPLELVLATPEVHRWHHSVVLEESNTNFGNTTVLWDRVFGTLHLPADRRPGTRLGIAGADIPEGYLSHLGAPFRLARAEADAGS